MNAIEDQKIRVRMTRNERALFENSLEGVKNYLEFGCGGSTEIVASRGTPKIISVESDRGWIEALSKKEHIAAALDAGRLKFEYVDIGPVKEWGVPKDESKIRNWPKYFLTPFTKYSLTYDYVLVDGRFRLACALAAHPFIGKSTVLAIHDYANRHKLFEVEKFYDITESSDTLFLFRKKENINQKSLYISVLSSLFQY